MVEKEAALASGPVVIKLDFTQVLTNDHQSSIVVRLPNDRLVTNTENTEKTSSKWNGTFDLNPSEVANGLRSKNGP
uniref:Uncharacterized protein n=1 Tax=Romanomermis culicivorax TaxID=13658 RepID=A0A915K8R7_ROMCU